MSVQLAAIRAVVKSKKIWVGCDEWTSNPFKRAYLCCCYVTWGALGHLVCPFALGTWVKTVLHWRVFGHNHSLGNPQKDHEGSCLWFNWVGVKCLCTPRLGSVRHLGLRRQTATNSDEPRRTTGFFEIALCDEPRRTATNRDELVFGPKNRDEPPKFGL